MTEPLGTVEEIAAARQKLDSVRDHNTDTVVSTLSEINTRMKQDAAMLVALSTASPYLFTRFLMREASQSLAQAVSLVAAAVELLPIDEGKLGKDGQLILPDPHEVTEYVDDGRGSGQYL